MKFSCADCGTKNVNCHCGVCDYLDYPLYCPKCKIHPTNLQRHDELKNCPKCGQGKFKVVTNSRCIICDNVIYDYGPSSSTGFGEKCKHREDGMVHCTTCDFEDSWEKHPSANANYEEFTGITNKPKKRWWKFWK